MMMGRTPEGFIMITPNSDYDNPNLYRDLIKKRNSAPAKLGKADNKHDSPQI
jgi:hypothetical protein